MMLKRLSLFFFIGTIAGALFIYYKQYHSTNKGNSMNQLDILFFEDQSLPYIRYTFASLKGGADFSPEEQSGLAFFTSYLLDQGSGGLSSEEIQNKLNYYGTQLNVDIGRQSVDLSVSGLSQHALPLLDLFLKIIHEPHFEPKELEMLRSQMIEGRLKALDDPAHVGSEIFREEIFGKNSIGQTSQGTVPSLKSISQENIKKFYEEHYKNAPAVFMITGKITPELKKQIKNLVETAFQKKQLSSFSPEQYKPNPASVFFKLVTKEDLIQSQVYIGHVLPSYPKDNPRKAIALNLGLSILGGHNLDARLIKRVREELGLTYGIYGSASFGRSYGVFTISGATKTKTTKQFIQETFNLVNDFVKSGITQEELESSKNVAKGYFARRIETKESVADFILYSHYYLGLNKNYKDQYLSIVESISLKEVHEAIQKYIHPDQLNVFVYGSPELKNSLNEIKPLTQIKSFKEHFSTEISF